MAPRILRFKKTIVIASIAALSVAGAGAAFAFWSSTGTGDGTATTGQAVQFVITEGAKAGTLAPGNLAGQTVAFTVSNPGPGQLYLGTVTVSLADAAGAAWVPPTDCLISDYSVTITTQPAPGTMAVGAGAARSGVATVVLANSALNQDTCKGAPVQLHFVANSTPPIPN
jgi:hypothetical protein